ncbi:MAG TPA: hypothetical protein VHL98_10835 [Microvirga sp.]|nr:hypothetical protein [Microvirga sp.]
MSKPGTTFVSYFHADQDRGAFGFGWATINIKIETREDVEAAHEAIARERPHLKGFNIISWQELPSAPIRQEPQP